MNKMFEELKSELFMCGQESIEKFLGYEIDFDEDEDVTDNRMNSAYEKMSKDSFLRFYNKFCVETKCSVKADFYNGKYY